MLYNVIYYTIHIYIYIYMQVLQHKEAGGELRQHLRPDARRNGANDD